MCSIIFSLYLEFYTRIKLERQIKTFKKYQKMPRRSRSYSSRSRSRSNEKWSRSPRGRREKVEIAPNTQIYVARFGRRTHESDLRKAFERYGRIVSIDIKYHGCYAFIVSKD